MTGEMNGDQMNTLLLTLMIIAGCIGVVALVLYAISFIGLYDRRLYREDSEADELPLDPDAYEFAVNRRRKLDAIRKFANMAMIIATAFILIMIFTVTRLSLDQHDAPSAPAPGVAAPR